MRVRPSFFISAATSSSGFWKLQLHTPKFSAVTYGPSARQPGKAAAAVAAAAVCRKSLLLIM